MKTSNARKVSEQAFNELVEAVEAGKSQRLVEYLKAMGRFHNYSVGNAMLIGFQKPEATHFAGFRTWQRLGRYIKKGEHGITIMAPIVYRKKNAEETDDKKPEDEVVTTFKTVHELLFAAVLLASLRLFLVCSRLCRVRLGDSMTLMCVGECHRV